MSTIADLVYTAPRSSDKGGIPLVDRNVLDLSLASAIQQYRRTANIRQKARLQVLLSKALGVLRARLRHVNTVSVAISLAQAMEPGHFSKAVGKMRGEIELLAAVVSG